MPNGQPLLAGGRPGLHLWLGDAQGRQWTAINVCAVHNSLVGNESDWKYASTYVNGTGDNCHKADGLPPQSTAYTSLLEVGDGEYVLLYDRLANGWHDPPGPYGDQDRAFAMKMSWGGGGRDTTGGADGDGQRDG